MRIASTALPVAVIALLVGCASSGPGADRALIFSGMAVPRCAFEVLEEVSVTIRIQGGRRAAESRLEPMLARRPAGTRPTEADLPAVPWTGRAQAIRFTDPACRG